MKPLEHINFTDKEKATAATRLQVLKEETIKFWTEALLSSSFMYNGKHQYTSGSGYKAGRWYDTPSGEEIPNEKIETFKRELSMEIDKTIQNILSRPVDVALLIGGEKYESAHYILGISDTFSFGGWDNDPVGEIKRALKAAGIAGAMNSYSGYRKKRVTLFTDDFSIRKGFHKYCDLICTV